MVYVDDFIVKGSEDSLISRLTHHLMHNFAIVKDLGILSYFLGIGVARCGDGLFLSQHKYILDLLCRFPMDSAKFISTPVSAMPPMTSYGVVDPSEYHSAIGGLQYLTLTRLDIAFTVNRLVQHMSSPSPTDWCSVKRLFRYLKGTLHHGLLLRRPTDLCLFAFDFDLEVRLIPNLHRVM